MLPALRGAVAVLALLGYLAASLGFPVPAPSPRRDHHASSTPHACQQRACGCEVSDDCRDHCCCSGEAPAPAPELESCPHCSGCGEAEGGCPLCAAAGGVAPCCEGKPAAKKARPAAPSVRWVHGVRARECRGADLLWYTLGEVIPLPPPTGWDWDRRPVAWLTSPSRRADSVPRAPPSPPPRPASAFSA